MTTPTSPAGSDTRPIYTTKTKIIIVVVVLLAGAGFALAVANTDTDAADDISVTGLEGQVANGRGGGGAGEIVEALRPGRGDEALSQTAIAIDLAPGWAVDHFEVNGVVVPGDQLDATPELALYEFSPNDDATVTELVAGTNCVTATVFQLAVGPEESRDERWCFEVT